MTLPDSYFRAELTEELVSTAAHHFKIGNATRSKDIEEGVNLNIDIESTSGRYLLRVYHQWMTKERIAFLHTIKRALLNRDILVPEPIGWAQSGELGLDLGRIIELERYIPHKRSEYTWAYHEQVFPILGQLHDALNNIVEDRDYIPPEFHNYALPSKMLEWLAMTESKIRAIHADEGDDIVSALNVCSRARDLLTVIDEWWHEQGANLPQQVVHGDFNTGTNVLILDNQSTAVLDFDFLDIHERVFEIAYSMFFAVGSLEWGKLLSERDWTRVARSVELYDSTCKRGFTEQEWESLPIEIARIPIYWVSTAGFNPEPDKKVLEDAEGIEQSYWIMDHLRDLIIPRNRI